MNEENKDWLPAKKEEETAALAPVQDTGSVAAAEAAKAEIQAAYAVAYRCPRDEVESRNKILKACKRKGFAESAEYKLPVGGGKSVTGYSIRAAEEFLRAMGNIRTSVSTTFENAEIRRVRVMATDLESNTGFGQEITIEKTVERKQLKDRESLGERRNSFGDVVHIVRATEAEMLTKENAAISKVLRNQGLRLVPGDILDDARTAIRKTLKGDGSKSAWDQAKEIAFAFSENLGIEAHLLEKFLGFPLAQVTDADIVELRRVYTAIHVEGEKIGPMIEMAEEARASAKNGKKGVEKAAKKGSKPTSEAPKGADEGDDTAKGATEPPAGELPGLVDKPENSAGEGGKSIEELMD